MGWARPAPHKGSGTTRTTTTPSPYGATPPHPGAGRETHSENPPRGGWFFYNLPNFPYGKGGFDVSGGGG